MQPQQSNKPVMDVTAPPKPAPAQPLSVPPSDVPPAAPAVKGPMAVALAPDAPPPLSPAANTADSNLHTDPLPGLDMTDPPEKPAAPVPPAKQPSAPASHLPVALITVTVLVMLALSGVAIMIYLTSQTA